jgi:hypothetical protein
MCDANVSEKHAVSIIRAKVTFVLVLELSWVLVPHRMTSKPRQHQHEAL